MDITDADQDSDAGYTTNQPDIVEHARQCYRNYPTIVNNIPKDKNVYGSSMDDFAAIDNASAYSQRDIGESSNLAQLAQTYACNYTDKKYSDYVCILSVLAQVAIDNAKRRFDLDLSKEIQRIRQDMDIKTHKYPAFWSLIKKDANKSNIHYGLHCPMNCLCGLELSKFHASSATLPMSQFFAKFPLEKNVRTCRKVEEFIQQYSLQAYEYHTASENDDEQYLLLRNDYQDLIHSIRQLYLSSHYIGLFSWLIDRAFLITPQTKGKQDKMLLTIEKNKSILLKILYDINADNLLKCFSKL